MGDEGGDMDRDEAGERDRNDDGDEDLYEDARFRGDQRSIFFDDFL